MANTIGKRPFQNFRTAITSPDYFCGRTEFLHDVIDSPMAVRILIAGRRLGKTSTLHAIEWTLLHPTAGNLNRAFPVYVSFPREQP